MKKIIYEENGITKIITPTKEALDIFSVEQIAENVLPTTNYKIVEDTEADMISAEINKKAQELAELEAEIAECENHIKHALIIGNNTVLENLRAEYKELIAERERLNVASEPTTVAPTDHL